MFFIMDVLKNFANFTGKHLCWRKPPAAASEQTQKISVVHLAKAIFGHLIILVCPGGLKLFVN